MLMAFHPSVLGGLLIVALFLMVFGFVYILRVITLFLTNRMDKKPEIAQPESKKVVYVTSKRKRQPKRLKPALESTLKKPLKSVYYLEEDE